MVEPPLQCSFTYSVSAFAGTPKPRLVRAVQRACNAWSDTGVVSLIEMPAELQLEVSLAFKIYRDGSITLTTAFSVLDLGKIKFTRYAWWSRLSGKPHLESVLVYCIGKFLLCQPNQLDTNERFHLPALTSTTLAPDETQLAALKQRLGLTTL